MYFPPAKMRILRHPLCICAAPDNHVAKDEFARRNVPVISERTFWLGVILCAALFVAVTTVFGSTSPQAGIGFACAASSEGALIFGVDRSVFVGEEPPLLLPNRALGWRLRWLEA
jgi:hypothetical protein